LLGHLRFRGWWYLGYGLHDAGVVAMELLM
jgi:hypothetical protein